MCIIDSVLNNESLLFSITSYFPITPTVNKLSGSKLICQNSMISYLIITLKDRPEMCSNNYIKKVTKFLPTHSLEFMMKLVKINGNLIKVADTHLKSDYNLLKIAISQNGHAMYYANDCIKDNIELAKLSLLNSGQLYYLSERLRSDKDIVKYAANIDPVSLRYVNAEWIKYDEDFAFQMINKRNPRLTSTILSVSMVPKNNVELSKICIEDLGYEAFRLLDIDLKQNKLLIKLCRQNYLKKEGYRNNKVSKGKTLVYG